MKELIEYTKQLYEKRTLIKYLTASNLKANNKNTALGYFWWLLEPLLMMLVYLVVIGVILKRGGPDYPVFLFIALLPWRAFMTSVNASMASITSNESLIKQILFPKGILPITATLGAYINFLFGLVILVALIFVFKIDLTFKVLLFPALVFLQLIFTLGVVFIFSLLNIYFRDIKNLSEHLFRVWLYLSPALYSITLVPEQFRTIYQLVNPFAVLFTSYRDVILYGRYPDFLMLAWVAFISIIVFLVGFIWFIRSEKSFVKVL